MAATVNVQELSGVGGDAATVTAARMCTTDTNNPVATYPIPIPDAGVNYSYWKTWRLAFTGTFTQVTNVYIYTDGTGFGTGITTNIGDSTGMTYVQATGTAGTTGLELNNTNYDGVTDVTDFFSFTSGSQKEVDTTTITTETTFSKVIAVQLAIATSATAGTLAAETVTWQYDEI